MTKAMATLSAEIISASSMTEQINLLVQEWLKKIDAMDLTKKTYARVMKNFVKYVEETQIDVINEENVAAYRDSLFTKNFSASSVRLYLTVVKMFVSFCADKGYCDNFAKYVKGTSEVSDAHIRKALTIDESKELLNTMKAGNLKEIRDKTVVSTMLATGARCKEICAMDISDITFRGKKIFSKIWGKGRRSKSDEIILPRQVFMQIVNYFATRKGISVDEVINFIKSDKKQRANNKNISVGEPIFTSVSRRNFGQRLTPQTISRLCKKALTDAGFYGVNGEYCAHSLRHTFATSAIKILGQEKIREVSQAMRHKGGVKITERYLHDLQSMDNEATASVASALFG